MEWVNHPHARGIGGRGWGGPRCFGTPPLPEPRAPPPGQPGDAAALPLPGRRSAHLCPLPAPPCARAAPRDGAGAGALAGGGGGADSPGAAPAAAAAAPRAGRGASSAPPPAPVAGPRLLPSPPLLLPFRTCGFQAEIARPQRGRRALSPAEASETQRTFTAEETETGDQDPLLPPEIQGPQPPAPPLLEKSGTRVISSPRTLGTELPTPSVLRCSNSPLLLLLPWGCRTPDSPPRFFAGPRTSSPPGRGALRAGSGRGGRHSEPAAEVEARTWTRILPGSVPTFVTLPCLF